MGTFSGDTSPIPSFQRVLSACYHAEIDVQMQMIWDCGIRVAISIRDNWETRSFSRGDRDDEFESWDALWEAVVLWMLDYLHRDWDNQDEGAAVDAGCLECTMGTTPNRFNTGLCIYHIAEHVLKAHRDKVPPPQPFLSPSEAAEPGKKP